MNNACTSPARLAAGSRLEHLALYYVGRITEKLKAITARPPKFWTVPDRRKADGATRLGSLVRGRSECGSYETADEVLRWVADGCPDRGEADDGFKRTAEHYKIVNRTVDSNPTTKPKLATVVGCCLELQATAQHVRDFAQMMAQRHGEHLADWIRAVETDNLPALHSLTVGLRRDQAAVTAGLTTTWSSGAVEGKVNRIKPSSGECMAETASRCYAKESCYAPDIQQDLRQNRIT